MSFINKDLFLIEEVSSEVVSRPLLMSFINSDSFFCLGGLVKGLESTLVDEFYQLGLVCVRKVSTNNINQVCNAL